MIAAVSERSDPFGGLDGYIQSLRGAPNRVPGGRPEFAGAKTQPGAQVPVPDIKTSSATPGAKTNSVIPYARVTPMDSKFNASRPGFPSFVAKTGSMPLGRNGGRQTLPERRSLCASLESVNQLLTMDGSDDDRYRTLQGPDEFSALNPLDEWRLVPFLNEWRLDGVALGVDTEENLSQVLNVAVGGVCRQVVNIFGGRRAPLETLYIGLVARLDDVTNRFVFEYVPFGENLLSSRLAQKTGTSAGSSCFDDQTHPLLRPEAGRDGSGNLRDDLTGIERMVGAWRLGVVTDTASVRDSSSIRDMPERSLDQSYMQLPVAEHNVSAEIVVEWVDWRSLIRRYPDCIVGRDHMLRSVPVICGIVYNFPHEDVYEPPSDPDILLYEQTYTDYTTRLVHRYDQEESVPCVAEAVLLQRPYLRCLYPSTGLVPVDAASVRRYAKYAAMFLKRQFAKGKDPTYKDVILQSFKTLDDTLASEDDKKAARERLQRMLQLYAKSMKVRVKDTDENGKVTEKVDNLRDVENYVQSWLAQGHPTVKIDKTAEPVLYAAYENAKSKLIEEAKSDLNYQKALASYVRDIVTDTSNLNDDGTALKKPALECIEDFVEVLTITEIFTRITTYVTRADVAFLE